jgi:hypothetical protein
MLILKRFFYWLHRLLSLAFIAIIIALLILSYPRIKMLLKDDTFAERISALDALGPHLLDLGKTEMSKHQVVICGITRDNAIFFETMKKYIEAIGKEFSDYKVILFENDSRDGTKELLAKWAAQNSKVTILTKDFHNKKRPNIKFMADARNYYLQELLKPQYDHFDIMMVVDMDMLYGFDIRGIRHSFSQISRWDAVCSNGIISGDRMYDAFAFRSKDFPYAPYEVGDDEYWHGIIPQIQKVIPATQDLMPVESCFGGLAFYKLSKAKDCLYDSIKNDCEHISFHKCIKEHKGEIFLNPAQMVRYATYDALTLILYAAIVKTQELWHDVMLK